MYVFSILCLQTFFLYFTYGKFCAMLLLSNPKIIFIPVPSCLAHLVDILITQDNVLGLSPESLGVCIYSLQTEGSFLSFSLQCAMWRKTCISNFGMSYNFCGYYVCFIRYQ
jgi:hypothetical protein